MGRGSLQRAALVLACSTIAPSSIQPVMAIPNANAYAQLSWDRAAIVTELTALPRGEFPLYLSLHGVQEAKVIGLDLRWHALGMDSVCYQMVDGPATDQCGRVVDSPPLWTRYYSGYTRRIEFQQPPSGDFCVVMWFANADSSGVQAARFRVAELVIESAEGDKTLIPTITEAEIAAADGSEPSTLLSPTGSRLVAGGSSHLLLRGSGLTRVSHVELEGAWGRLKGDVLGGGDRSVHVSFDIPKGRSGNARLIASDGRSMLDMLPVYISPADTTAESGDGVNRTAYFFDKPADGGVWRKHGGASNWVFVPAVPDSIVNLGGRAVGHYLALHPGPRRSLRALEVLRPARVVPSACLIGLVPMRDQPLAPRADQ